MNATRLNTLIAELSLAESRPLGPELSKLRSPAAALASSGDLHGALRKLRFSEELLHVARLWPAAVRGAQQLLGRIPSSSALSLPLYVTSGYLWIVLLVQLMVFAVLRLKVLPLVEFIAQTSVGSASSLVPIALLFGALPVVVLSTVMLKGWHWMPGWGRELTRAREAAITRALIDARAPTDAVSAWLRTTNTLRLVDAAALPADLDAIAHFSVASAQRSIERLSTFIRVGGILILSVSGFAIVFSVYRLMAEVGVTR